MFVKYKIIILINKDKSCKFYECLMRLKFQRCGFANTSQTFNYVARLSSILHVKSTQINGLFPKKWKTGNFKF